MGGWGGLRLVRLGDLASLIGGVGVWSRRLQKLFLLFSDCDE